MKLIVGLGNPGRKYAATRHNVGFGVIAELASQFGQGGPRGRFQGEAVDAMISSQRILLLCPMTYMNASGTSVRQALDFYKIPETNVLIVCDDLNLPLGKLRIRARGSSGGQKGLQDICRLLGTERIARLRVGIGVPPEGWNAADYVLGKFSANEQVLIEQAIGVAAHAAADWVRDGTQFCMNRYNADVPRSGETTE